MGTAFDPDVLVNSSDQTSVPETMFGVKLWLATLLAVYPAAVAMALTVMLLATRNGAWYCCEDEVGVDPSTV